MRRHLTDAEVVESMLALGLFVGFSKMMIALGLEPDGMETTVWATPDLPADEREPVDV